jgi:hypothetical protein
VDLGVSAEVVRDGHLVRSKYLATDEEVTEGFQEFLSLDSEGGEIVAWAEEGRTLGVSFGSVIVLGFIPRPGRTDFMFSSLFVPFLHRSFADVESERGRVMNVDIGESMEIQVEDIGTYRLVREGGASLALKASLRAQRPLLTLSGIEEPGIYTLLKGEDRVARIAANLDPRESDPTPLSAAERTQFLGDARVFENIDEFFEFLGPQISLKIPLFWAALAFLLLEMILLRWRGLRRRAIARRGNTLPPHRSM